MILKELTMLDGVSGNEDAVRDFILSHLKPHCDNVQVDKLGNVIVFKKGRSSAKKIMLCAHMDEVGLIVKGIDEDGYLHFAPVGGIDARVLLGKRVDVAGIPGVIGIKAVHMTTPEQREQAVKMSDMYIDVGAESRDEVTAQIGDYVSFVKEYTEFGQDCICAKALDDRVGCAALLEIAKKADFAYDSYLCFTVQEEIGLRGAEAIARKISPDVCIALEGTVCQDTHGVPEHLWVTKQGGGPAISAIERQIAHTRELVQGIQKIAKESNVPCQLKRTNVGGNDTRGVQTVGAGCRTVALSVPCRYIHGFAGVVAKKDCDALTELAGAMMERMDELC